MPRLWDVGLVVFALLCGGDRVGRRLPCNCQDWCFSCALSVKPCAEDEGLEIKRDWGSSCSQGRGIQSLRPSSVFP